MAFGCSQIDDEKTSEPEKCTLTYNANGGSGEMKSTTANKGSEITLAENTFTKIGYTFAGWNTEEDGSDEKYADKAKIKLTANTTLYAQWTANVYTVKFDKNADDATGDAPADIQATYDVEFELPENTFTKIGYNFAGWKDDSGKDYKDKEKVKNLTTENGATVTLYAQWDERETHKITYKLNGGSHIGTQKEQFKETEDVTLGKAEKTGYTFDGWYETEDFSGTAVTSWKAGEKTEDVTLYAQWTANKYTVTFDKNANDATGTMESQTFTYGTSQALSENNFYRMSYKFVGWATSADGEVTYNDKQDYSIGTEDVTLYAKWKAIVYSITYELDGGTNAPDNPASYTIEDSIPLKDPTKDGYTFLGWYDNILCNENSKISKITAGTSFAITLYAKWLVADKFIKVPAVSINGSEIWTPASEVFVSGRALDIKAFYMSDHEVTQAEWKDVMGSAPSDMAPADGNADNNPVNYVNWYEAIVYCNKRSIKEDLKPYYTINGFTNPDDWGEVPTSSNDTWNDVTRNIDANGYRLPTEAEWEWAARGGENYKFSGSDEIKDVAWYRENTNETRVVRTKKANGYGLYDMSGNVWEWCWDWYLYGSISTDTPAEGASSGSFRCLRGGSWNNGGSSCGVAFQYGDFPNSRYNYYGLRVVRTAE